MLENKNTSFVLDPWKNYEHLIGINESKAATMHNYRKALLFSKIPKIERKKKNDLVVMGTGLYLKLDQSLRQKTHVVISARDILKDSVMFEHPVAAFNRRIWFEKTLVYQVSLVENLTIYEHFWPSIELVGRHQSFLNHK